MGKIIAVCVSEARGTEKKNVGSAVLKADWGIEGDAHAGHWHRQVSLLSYDKVEEFNARGAGVTDGAFGENLLVEGIDFRSLPVGTRLRCGNALLEITQIGKECHHGCAIRQRVGDCIMPREGVFARVLRGGTVESGMDMRLCFKVGIVTASDKGAAGAREDKSGPLISELLPAGFYEGCRVVVPDDQKTIEDTLRRLCDEEGCDLVLTTGGTALRCVM